MSAETSQLPYLAQLPFTVDERTEKMPCAPGAWGSPERCLCHEGQPLDEHGRCFWGRKLENIGRTSCGSRPAPADPRQLSLDELLPPSRRGSPC